MSEKLDRFVGLMKEIFELDKSDLDFGIYRIMNLRKAKIEDFLENGLPKKVQEALAPFAQGDKSKITARMTEIESQLGDVSALPDTIPMVKEYNDLKKQLATGTDLAALETDVYSALYSFFNRYYDEGDFVSKRRYKEGVYAIPYEGEEVKLYWANQDQYYIKTSENFKDYSFVASNMYGDSVNVHFELVDATTEQNNNKESDDSKRTFMLYTENDERPELKTFEYRAETNELIIRFVFDIPEDKKKKYAEENYNAIFEWIVKNHNELYGILLKPSEDKKDSLNLLQKHLKSYVAKNTFDYFIHKDLRGFLSRELDFYIKTEIMHLDDLDTENEKQAESYIAKIRAIKRVGKIIIDFLAQIEDFQKKLWLKKKFVVETNWCMTLDRVDESFWQEIIDNNAQIDEWIAMYAIDEVEGDLTSVGWTNPPSMEFLRQNQNLVIDTKHFNNDFKERLVASIDNLDEKTNGLMINGDNYHAIRLLNEKYNGKIQLTYIDPPYNTDASKIQYKNGYEHSSWISLMDSRLSEGRQLMSDSGVIEVAIDDYELRYLSSCMDQVFGVKNAISNIAILTNPKGRDQDFIAAAHDYSVIYAKNKELAKTNNFILNEEEMAKKFSKAKDGEALRELPLKRTGSDKLRENRPYMYFPFFYSVETKELLVIPKEDYKKIYNAKTDTFNDDFLENIIKQYKDNGYIAILPLSSKGEKFRWRWGYDSCKKGIESGILFCKEVRGGGFAIYQYDFANDEACPKSLWFGEKYDASSKGTNILESIIPNNTFKFPKSLFTVEDNIIIGSDVTDTVLDYFAGSGTTGHAIVDLNRSIEDSNRSYILVDMGEYFYSVTKTRMQKVVYSADWKDGKPVNRNTGVSQIIKYMRLESYEDALSNIEMQSNDMAMSLFGDEYLINYMIDIETKGSLLNLEKFKEPFRYEMKITEKNESKKRPVDVVETFNYLIGLTVSSQGAVSYFDAVSAKAPAYEGAVDLMKNNSGEFGFKQIEGTLPDGRRALVIWRTVSDDILKSNAALDAYFTKYRINPLDREYDVIFVNGDNNLENLRTDKESWKVQMTETEFKARMFEEE